MSKHLIPVLLAVADIVQAVVCCFHGDWARAMYWACAGGITYSTVLMKA